MEEQSEQCPTCGKPVMGRTALLAHLEFSHEVAAPQDFLRALEHPPRERRNWQPILKLSGVVVASVALAVGGFVVVSGASNGDAAVDAAASDTGGPTTAPSTTEASTTTQPTTTTAAPTTTTTVAPTTVPTTTQVLPRDAELAEEDFRKPFLRDAHVVLCRSSGGQDVYRVGFTLSGSRDIVLDGDAYPDRTGDGLHVVDRPIAAGSTTYLDEILVADGGGTEHAVPVTPPLYLGGC